MLAWWVWWRSAILEIGNSANEWEVQLTVNPGNDNGCCSPSYSYRRMSLADRSESLIVKLLHRYSSLLPGVAFALVKSSSKQLLLSLNIPRKVGAVIQLILRVSVSHKSEPVSRFVTDVKIFWTNMIDHLMEQYSAARECGCHSTIDSIVLVPRSTYITVSITPKSRTCHRQFPVQVRVFMISSPYRTNSSTTCCFGAMDAISSLAIFLSHCIIHSAVQSKLYMSDPCPTVAFGPINIK